MPVLVSHQDSNGKCASVVSDHHLFRYPCSYHWRMSTHISVSSRRTRPKYFRGRLKGLTFCSQFLAIGSKKYSYVEPLQWTKLRWLMAVFRPLPSSVCKPCHNGCFKHRHRLRPYCLSHAHTLEAPAIARTVRLLFHCTLCDVLTLRRKLQLGFLFSVSTLIILIDVIRLPLIVKQVESQSSRSLVRASLPWNLQNLLELR